MSRPPAFLRQNTDGHTAWFVSSNPMCNRYLWTKNHEMINWSLKYSLAIEITTSRWRTHAQLIWFVLVRVWWHSITHTPFSQLKISPFQHSMMMTKITSAILVQLSCLYAQCLYAHMLTSVKIWAALGLLLTPASLNLLFCSSIINDSAPLARRGRSTCYYTTFLTFSSRL